MVRRDGAACQWNGTLSLIWVFVVFVAMGEVFGCAFELNFTMMKILWKTICYLGILEKDPWHKNSEMVMVVH